MCFVGECLLLQIKKSLLHRGVQLCLGSYMALVMVGRY